MFSKLTLKAGVLSVLAVILCLNTGCDKFLKSRSKQEQLDAQKVTISTDEVKCLSSTAVNLQKFFADEGDSAVLNKTIGCVQSSLKTFMRLTRGSQPNGYLASEVQYFFNTFLLKDNQVSDDFLREIMKIKVAVVGGSPDVLTRLELEQFGDFLGKLQVQMQQLQGKMKVTLFKGEASLSPVEKVEQIQQDLMSLSSFVLKNTKITSSRYQWVDFIAFLTELRSFMGESQELEELLKWVPLAESVKLLFLGENAKLVGDSDWQYAATWTVNTYATALKFRYQIRDNPFETPAQWNTLLSWLDEGIHAIESSPAMRDRKILEGKALDRLMDEIYKLNFFDTVISPEMAKSVYRKALVHFIEAPNGRGDPLAVQGLTEAHLRILKQEYNVWKLSQRFLVDIYSQHPSLKLVNLRWYVARYDISRVLSDASSMEREELERSWKDFQDIINSQPGITYDKKMKVRIAPRNETEEFPFVGANMLNGLRSFARLVMRGYGDHQTRFVFDSKLYKPRMMNLEEDFRDFARQIGLLDPRENNAASRTFDQGNFFTYHGNGDNALTAMETFEVFNLMVSGARTQLNEVYADLKSNNCLIDQKDIFGKPYVKEDCYLRMFRQKYPQYLDNLPGMVLFFQSLNDQQWTATYQALLSLGISKTHTPGYLESSEIRSMNTVYHFLETLMLVYDRNQNQRLSEAEVLASLPRFGGFIQNIIAKKPSWLDRNVGPYFLEDILLFLAYEGHEPTGADLVAFKAKRAMGGLGEIGRGNLVTLLSVLNNLLTDSLNAQQ
jgi:hypothetical protein